MGNLASVRSGTEAAPDWVPPGAIHYLAHTALRLPIRAIAREVGCHASTISRQIRRLESRRDDPLVDDALDRLGSNHFSQIHEPTAHEDISEMTALPKSAVFGQSDDRIEHESRRILRRLAENGAVLAVAQEMEKAVVVRDLPGGKSARTAVVDRDVAEAMALKDWISCAKPGRIARYQITSTGRAALKRLLIQTAKDGFAEAVQPFAEQHREWGEREIVEQGSDENRRLKTNLSESPLVALSRRRDKDGKPFLSDELVAAGERLREDFELAQMGPSVAQNWERFLTGGDRGGFAGGNGLAEGPRAARERVAAALRDLGPGLGDVVLRCCCFLEGLETTERNMGWSARSGKIVLRIALQRLWRHYEETHGRYGPMIG